MKKFKLESVVLKIAALGSLFASLGGYSPVANAKGGISHGGGDAVICDNRNLSVRWALSGSFGLL